jgi:hypothetical protein
MTWLLAVPAIIGGVSLWRRSEIARFAIIYLAFTLILYGSFPELQGPRHRIQALWVIAWLDFHGLWIWIGAGRIESRSIKRA